MHELHLIKGMIADLLKSAGEEKIKKISRVSLKMGEFVEINPGILKSYFLEQARGTIAEGAEIYIEPGATREMRLLSFDGE